MIYKKLDKDKPKGWYVGPWNSNVSVPIGYANEGIDENHFHSEMYEIYLVAKGTATAVVNKERIVLKEGDILVVEPGEHHTFLESLEGYLHFVIHSPFKEGDKIMIK